MFHPKGPTFFELAQQALSSTRRGYDLLAPKFDYTPFRTPEIVLDEVARHLRHSTSPGTAIDLCCGTGAAVEMLLPICTDRVVGVDFSESMIKQAASNIETAIARLKEVDEHHLIPKVQWQSGDVLQLPCENEFDLAVCFGAFGHFVGDDEPAFLDQVERCLKPGGRFVFVTTYMPGFFSPAHLLARGFNFSMHMRNLFFRPPFIMFYLTFILPAVKEQLENRGFEVKEYSPYTGAVAGLKLVEATKKR